MRRLLPVLWAASWACSQSIQVARSGDGGMDGAATDAPGESQDVMSSPVGTPDGASGGPDAPAPTGTDGAPSPPDASMPVVDAGFPACIVDPFTSCTDPDEGANGNNDPSSTVPLYDLTYSPCGNDHRDTIVPYNHTRSGTLCPGDPADFYQVWIWCCDTLTGTAEIRLHPTTPCDPNDYAFVFESTTPFDCSNPPAGFTCMHDGNDTVVRRTIPPCSSVGYWEFGIVALFPSDPTRSLMLSYDLSIRIQ